jgi:type I restriction enzyme S subunit
MGRMTQYTVKKWDEVVDIVSGKNQKTVANVNGKYAIYGSGGPMGRADDFLCEAGTTIVGRKGTINKPIFVNECFWNVDTAFGIHPSSQLVPKFLYYFCCSFNFTTLDKSTTIPSLAKRDLLNIKMPVPSISEQERIVARIEELFSELDKAVETLKTTKEQLTVYRQAVLKEAFESECRLRKLEELCDFITKGTTPKKCDLFTKGDIPFIKVYNLTFDTSLDFSIEPTFIPNEIHKGALARSIVWPGDVLMNIVGPPLGKVSIVPNVYKEWNINQAIARFRCKENLNNKYLAYYLGYVPVIEKMKAQSKATAGQINLTLEICRNIEIPCPPVKKQKEIVEQIESRLSVCDSIEQAVDTALQQAEAMRQSILKQAFEGRLV